MPHTNENKNHTSMEQQVLNTKYMEQINLIHPQRVLQIGNRMYYNKWRGIRRTF